MVQKLLSEITMFVFLSYSILLNLGEISRTWEDIFDADYIEGYVLSVRYLQNHSRKSSNFGVSFPMALY